MGFNRGHFRRDAVKIAQIIVADHTDIFRHRKTGFADGIYCAGSQPVIKGKNSSGERVPVSCYKVCKQVLGCFIQPGIGFQDQLRLQGSTGLGKCPFNSFHTLLVGNIASHSS